MSYKNPPLKILSIKPGTRSLAVAVLEGRDLVYWKNKLIRNADTTDARTLKKLGTVLNGLIDFWTPDAIAVEDICFYVQAKENPLLNKMVRKTEEICKKRGLEVYFYAPIPVREFICGDAKPNKMNAAGVIATRHYPWLREDYEKEKRKKWYEMKSGLRIFDAVAVGLFCLNELKNNRKNKNAKTRYVKNKK